MTDQDTAELVRRAAAGDELAWRQIIDGLGPLLRRVSLAYRLGEAEAADAVATAWLRLFENIGSLRDGSAVPGWLITTLRRECLTRARARSRERPVADFAGVDEPVDVVDFDRWLLDADRRQMVHRALMELSEQQRQLIVMLFARPSAFVCGDKRKPRDSDRQHRSYALQAARQASRCHVGTGGAGARKRLLNSIMAQPFPIVC
jgi:RNA polymerase sigma factor (sigma-70 family)